MCRCEDSGDTSMTRITRNLILERRNEKRSVWMLQYTGWPDTGVPQTEHETRDFIGKLFLLKMIVSAKFALYSM